MRKPTTLACGIAIAAAGCATSAEQSVYEIDRYLKVPSVSSGGSARPNASLTRVPAPRRAAERDFPPGAVAE